MGLHRRDLANDEFTGKELLNKPSDVGAAPPAISPTTAFAVLVVVLIAVLGFGFGR